MWSENFLLLLGEFVHTKLHEVVLNLMFHWLHDAVTSSSKVGIFCLKTLRQILPLHFYLLKGSLKTSGYNQSINQSDKTSRCISHKECLSMEERTCLSLWVSLELFISLFCSLASVIKGLQWPFSLALWVQQGHFAFSLTRSLSKSASSGPQAIHFGSYFAIYAAQWALQMPSLYPRKPWNDSSALRFDSCPVYLEFLSLSQLPPLYTLGLGLGHWALSQRQSMAKLSYRHSASFPPPARGKKCTSYSICEETIFTIMVPSWHSGFHVGCSLSHTLGSWY